MHTISDYLVTLKVFHGPLDLLLYLVRRAELDIRTLPLGQITREFIGFLEVLELLDLELTGDFVVTASTLMEIKSREALPQTETPDEEVEEPTTTDDPRSDLVQKLLEYRKYKEAATALEDRAARWQERYPRLSSDRPTSEKDPRTDRIKDVELWDLVSALSRVLQSKQLELVAKIKKDDTPITVHMDRIREVVNREQRVAFSRFFAGTNERSRIVGIFLAILELLRHHGYRADQPSLHGEIWVLPPLESPDENPGFSPAAPTHELDT